MHMNDGRVVSNFILQALQGEPLTVGAGLAGPRDTCNPNQESAKSDGGQMDLDSGNSISSIAI